MVRPLEQRSSTMAQTLAEGGGYNVMGSVLVVFFHASRAVLKVTIVGVGFLRL